MYFYFPLFCKNSSILQTIKSIRLHGEETNATGKKKREKRQGGTHFFFFVFFSLLSQKVSLIFFPDQSKKIRPGRRRRRPRPRWPPGRPRPREPSSCCCCRFSSSKETEKKWRERSQGGERASLSCRRCPQSLPRPAPPRSDRALGGRWRRRRRRRGRSLGLFLDHCRRRLLGRCLALLLPLLLPLSPSSSPDHDLEPLGGLLLAHQGHPDQQDPGLVVGRDAREVGVAREVQGQAQWFPRDEERIVTPSALGSAFDRGGVDEEAPRPPRHRCRSSRGSVPEGRR